MGRKLYVGNLPFAMTSQDLEDVFSGVGKVSSAKVIVDFSTNKSKGFGFVEMDNDSLAKEAIEVLNETDLKGRKLKVSYAAPKPPRSRQSEPMVNYR